MIVDFTSWEFLWLSCLFLPVLWGILVALSKVLQMIWGWVDDDKKEYDNWVGKFTRFHKYKYPVYTLSYSNNLYGFSDDKEDAGGYIARTKGKIITSFEELLLDLFNMTLISSIPLLVKIGITIYPVVIVVGTVAGLAFTLRFSRRLSKKFKTHTEDTNAHKGGA